MKYIKGLDVLRAFAVGLVLIAHWGPHTIRSSGILTFFFSKIIPDGRFGVDLFFVLSGFLITDILVRAKENAVGHSRTTIIKAFYIRRILRIFPVYYLLLLILYLIKNEEIHSNWLYFVTYTSNFLVFKEQAWSSVSHTWSLSVEEQFYLLWPWLIVYLPRKTLVGACILFFAIGVASSYLIQKEYGSFYYVLPMPCFTAFSTGAFYACVKADQKTRNTERFFMLLFPVCLILFIFHQQGYISWCERIVNSVISINFIIYILKGNYNGFTGRLLNNRVLASIGKVSYGIYLYHYVLPAISNRLIIWLNKDMRLSDQLIKRMIYPPCSYFRDLLAVMFLSYVSYYFLEAPILKLKSKFAYVPKK